MPIWIFQKISGDQQGVRMIEYTFTQRAKGQLISKAKCQAVDSPKKRTNEFAFFDFKSCYVAKSNAIRLFFWRK